MVLSGLTDMVINNDYKKKLGVLALAFKLLYLCILGESSHVYLKLRWSWSYCSSVFFSLSLFKMELKYS